MLEISPSSLDHDQTAALGAVAAPADRPLRAYRRVLRKPTAIAALAILLAFVAMALLAPALAPFDPNEQDLRLIHREPSGEHLLGTDQLGRDVLSRVIFGSRVSLLASLQAVAIAVALGVPLGMVAGYFSDRADMVLSRLNDMLMSVPGLVLALTVVAVLGPGLRNAMLAVGVILAPVFFRIMRAATMEIRHQLFIEASVTVGCSRARVMWAHVLPNALTPVLVQTSLVFGGAVLAEAALSYLGLGVAPPTASWGSMLATATQRLERTYLIWGPGVCLMLLVLAFTMLGDALQDVLSGHRDRARR